MVQYHRSRISLSHDGASLYTNDNNTNVPTMTIPNVTTINILKVPIELEPNVHRDIIVEANIDEAIDEATKWTWIKSTYPLLIFIHRPMMSPVLCCQHQVSNQ